MYDSPLFAIPIKTSGIVSFVTSVALSAPDIFNVSGSPVTTAGTLAFTPTDPNADRIVFWDDSAGKWQYLTPGTNLTITGTTLDATGGVSGLSDKAVLFGNGSGTISQDTTNFIWDDTNNRLGLGTASPQEQLQLTANIRLASTSIIKYGANRWIHITGADNIFIGENAGNLSVSGAGANVCMGFLAGFSLTNGYNNMLLGYTAGVSITGGSDNMMIGPQTGGAITSGARNIAIGTQCCILNPTTGIENTIIGNASSVNSGAASNRIVIGAAVTNNEDYTALIGNDSVAYIANHGDGVCYLGANNHHFKGLFLDYTNTAPGTTGAQTINKAVGRVNIAAAGTSVVVTNALVTAASLVIPILLTNDATAAIKNVVPTAGAFTIRLTAAATAEVAIGFLVINTD